MINRKFLKAKYGWTYSGFIYLNLFMVTTLVVVSLSNGHSFFKAIAVLPQALLIINAANFVVMPIADFVENYNDRKMCAKLNQNYESDFLFTYNVKQKEKIRSNFKSLNDYDGASLEVLSQRKLGNGT